MSPRQLLAAALLATLALTGAACNSSSDTAKAAKSTTSKAPTSTAGASTETSAATGDTTDTTEAPTDTTPKQKFGEAIDQLNSSLDASKGDVCKLFGLFDTTAQVEDPSNAEEGKQAVKYVVNLLTAIADAAPSSLSAEADTIRNTAKKVDTEAAAKDYAPSFLSSQDFTAFNDPTFGTAMQKFSEAANTQCGAPAAGAGN